MATPKGLGFSDIEHDQNARFCKWSGSHMTTVNIDRFCSIEGVHCSRLVEYKGAWSAFLAYPSGAHWRDLTGLLAQELSERGLSVDRWEDIVKGDILFTKVCEGIHAHDVLLAEVTDANANVLIEVGYALAVGRLPILLVDKNRPRWKRLLLRILETSFYETREDIHGHVMGLMATREALETPADHLPLLEQMGIFDIEERGGTVYHVRPKLTTDAIRRVESVLQDSSFKPTSMDPSDTAYDEFFDQARKIRESQLVVASLLSEAHNDYEVHNANVGLLIGFAVGLGKRVLVLQQEPVVPILDIGTVSRPFTTESQAKAILEGWLKDRTTEALAVAQEVKTAETRRARTHVIKGLYLGHPDALQDYDLLNYFAPTEEYYDALDGRRSLFLGRRGAGKSATFEAVCDALERQHSTIHIPIAPEELELHRVGGFFRSAFADTNRDLLYQSVWNFVLLTEIANALHHSPLLYESPTDLARSLLYRCVTEHSEELSMDFGTRLQNHLRGIDDLSADGGFAAVSKRLDEAAKSLRDHDRGRRLREFATTHDLTFFIVIDDLDKHWIPEDSHSTGLLLGLAAESDRLRRFFGNRLRMAIFLRDDMYDVMARHDPDFQKRDYTRMEWTAANLKHLVAERIAWGADVENDDDDLTWASIYPANVGSQAASEYIIGRALPRPRDVLKFAQFSLDEARRNGHEQVTEQDVLDAEDRFSEDEFRTVSTEYQHSMPFLDEVLLELAGAPTTMPWSTFREYAKTIIDKFRDKLGSWPGTREKDAAYITEILYRVGVAGLGIPPAPPMFADGRSFAEVWGATSPSPHITIHPAFVRFLDLKPAGSEQSRGRSLRTS